MHGPFKTFCSRTPGEAMLVIGDEATRVRIIDLEEEYISYEPESKIRLTGMVDHRTFGKNVTQRVTDMAYKRVIFNAPATIVLWRDGSKTVVTCKKGDQYDPEKGLALCFMKKALGNKGNFNNILKAGLLESKR